MKLTSLCVFLILLTAMKGSAQSAANFLVARGLPEAYLSDIKMSKVVVCKEDQSVLKARGKRWNGMAGQEKQIFRQGLIIMLFLKNHLNPLPVRLL